MSYRLDTATRAMYDDHRRSGTNTRFAHERVADKTINDCNSRIETDNSYAEFSELAKNHKKENVMSLSGKTVLITGGGTGIGAGCATAFAEAGAKVAISGRREEKLKEVADSYSGDNSILLHPCDVANRDDVSQLVNWASQELGQIDILVHCAGINIANRQMNVLDPADWDKLMQVNATGAYNMMHSILPQMRQRKDGLIISVSSIAGLRASLLGGVAYSASKFAMTVLGTCVGLEERENGIRVTNVYPGEVETPILDARPNPVSAEHRARILQPSDIAAMIVAVAQLPPRAHVPDLVIKPTTQEFF